MSSYLDYLKDKFNALLAEKVGEDANEYSHGVESLAGSGSSGTSTGSGSGSGSSGTSSTPKGNKDLVLDGLNAFIAEQYKTAEVVKPDVGSVPEYERIEVSAPTNEQIKANAEALLSDYAAGTLSAIDDEIAALEKQYSAQKQTAAANYQSADSNLAQVYKDAKENAASDMLKRGLARSSISANVVSRLENELAGKRSDVLSNYISEIGQLESQIAALDTKKIKALSDFNIAYAAKLTAQISELTEKRDKQVAEAIKYNNSLTEKEFEQQNDKMLNESKLYSDELAQAQKQKDLGTTTEAKQKQIYASIYAEMDKMLSTLSKKDAKELVQSSPIFRQYLTDYYYYAIMDKYGR